MVKVNEAIHIEVCSLVWDRVYYGVLPRAELHYGAINLAIYWPVFDECNKLNSLSIHQLF